VNSEVKKIDNKKHEREKDIAKVDCFSERKKYSGHKLYHAMNKTKHIVQTNL
jgi:hypothetical protein